jgi:hypothetical protein
MIVVDVETLNERNDVGDVQVGVFELIEQQKLLQMKGIDEGTSRA